MVRHGVTIRFFSWAAWVFERDPSKVFLLASQGTRNAASVLQRALVQRRWELCGDHLGATADRPSTTVPDIIIPPALVWRGPVLKRKSVSLRLPLLPSANLFETC